MRIACQPRNIAGWFGVGLVYGFLYCPMLVLTIFSFNAASRVSAEWEGFTFQWYLELFRNEAILEALWNSCVIAFAAAGLSSLLGLTVGWVMVRGRSFESRILELSAMTQILLPEVVVGLAYLCTFVWWGIPLGKGSVILAHTAFGTAYVAIQVRTRLLSLDSLLEDAAADLGATRVTVLRRIIFPQLAPGVVAGALMVLVLSFDDCVIAFLTAGVGATTLPLKIYSMVKFGLRPELNALTVLILGVSIGLVAVSYLIRQRHRQRLQRSGRNTQMNRMNEFKIPQKQVISVGVLFFALMAWLVSGCTKKHTGDPVAAVEASSGGSKKVLHLYAMADYFPEKLIKDFEAKHGCEIRYDNFANNEELLAKLQAGATGYDVIVPSDYMVSALIAGKLVQALDLEKIPNRRNLARAFNEVPFDAGNKHSIPYTWGTTGLAYDTKKIKFEIKSWNDLFKPELKGHLSLLDDGREAIGAMLRLKGHSLNTTDEKKLAEAKALLTKLKPSVRIFTSDPKQHLISGDVWVGHIYSGDAQQAIGANANIKFVVPEEGAVIWVDTLAIPKGAPHPELAYAFIDTVLDAGNALSLVDELKYGSPNAAIDSKVKDPTLRSSYYTSLKPGTLEFISDLGAATALWDQTWSEVKSM